MQRALVLRYFEALAASISRGFRRYHPAKTAASHRLYHRPFFWEVRYCEVLLTPHNCLVTYLTSYCDGPHNYGPKTAFGPLTQLLPTLGTQP